MTEVRATHIPDSPSPPGETIADILEEKGWTQTELCTRLGYTTKHVSQLINGKASITEDTALRLERVVGGDMAFWLNREALYRESVARADEAPGLDKHKDWLKELPIKDMIRFGWIARAANPGQQVAECLRYFGVASVEAWRARYTDLDSMGLAYRASEKFAKVAGHVAAWLRQGEIEASAIQCKAYDEAAFRNLLLDLRALTREGNPDKFLPALVTKCASVGVAVVFVRAPAGCPASGVTRWLTPDKALVMLSLRYRKNDHLWFTFFHEAGHILLHSKKLMFMEVAKNGLDNKEEREADKFSADLLIKPDDLAAFCRSVPSAETVQQFATRIGIAPGIVVGRLQKERVIDWADLNYLKLTYVWAHEAQD